MRGDHRPLHDDLSVVRRSLYLCAVTRQAPLTACDDRHRTVSATACRDGALACGKNRTDGGVCQMRSLPSHCLPAPVLYELCESHAVCTVLYCSMLWCTSHVLCCVVLYFTVLNSALLYCTVLYRTVLYCIVCTVLSVRCCAVLHMYCTVPATPCCTVRYRVCGSDRSFYAGHLYVEELCQSDSQSSFMQTPQPGTYRRTVPFSVVLRFSASYCAFQRRTAPFSDTRAVLHRSVHFCAVPFSAVPRRSVQSVRGCNCRRIAPLRSVPITSTVWPVDGNDPTYTSERRHRLSLS